MKKLLLCLLLITGLAHISKTQNISDKYMVSGQLVDQNNDPLVGATSVVLSAKDSVMAGYSISNFNGKFQIGGIPIGEFIIQVSYLGFVNISKKLNVSQSIDLGLIVLDEESRRLDEVNITADHIPIMLKKDTIEYNSAAFSTQINDKVEELLRQLPGVEVEEDGTIKAQGEEVEKILVDGKDFFGDDPQVATKNLPAEAVDKVQVFDKLSELAEFTGIDDGERRKTINLTLKDGHKKGMFGDLTGGYGNNNRYEGKANLHRFDDQSQVSLLSAINNTNTQNFSIDDYINFSGGLQGLTGGGGRINLSMNELGMAPSNGISKSQSLGLNFNRTFSNRTSLESNYFFTGIQNVLIQDSERENRIENGVYRSTQSQNRETVNFNHKLNFSLKHEWNNQDINFRGNAKSNFGNVNNLSNNLTYDTVGRLSNAIEYDNSSKGDNVKFDASLTYRNRLNSKGRTVVMNVNSSTQNDEKLADQKSESVFYNNQTEDQLLLINQNQDQSEGVFNYGVALTFTEPWGYRKYLSASYSFNANSNQFSKEFYDLNLGGAQVFNSELSDNYKRRYNYHRAGLRVLISREKSKTTIGLEMQLSKLKGTYANESVDVGKAFHNVLPSIRWNYEFSSSSSLEASYGTDVTPPNVIQLQPFIDNSNPLMLYRGNPGLNAEYAHRLGINYRLFDMFNFTNLFLAIRGIYTHDKITNSSQLTEDFAQLVSPINVDSDFMLNSYLSFGTPIRSLGAKIGLDISSTYGKSYLYINAIENVTDRWINSYDFSIENRKKKDLDLKGGVRLAHNSTHYSKRNQLDQKFSQLTYYGHFRLNFLEKWSFNAKFEYKTYLGESFSSNASFPLLSAYISRNVMRYDRGQIKLYVFDLLDQNTGINRVNDFNYIEDQRFNAMSQYFMFSFTYSLSKFGQSVS